MIGGIGKGDSLARAAIESALKRQAELLERMEQKSSGLPGSSSSIASTETSSSSKPAFESVLSEGVRAVDEKARESGRLHVDVLAGGLDVHEVAARLQQTKLAFDFAMQVRDRFVDAYREVMRMNV